MTKTQRAYFKEVKNLVAADKENDAVAFKLQVKMNERQYHEAVEAGRKLRKEVG